MQNKILTPFFKGFFTLLLLAMSIGQVWAGSASTQARAYLKDGSPSGSGKVYIAANDATTPNDNQYKDCTADGITMDGTSGKSKKSTFYFYAKAKTGYKFTGWYKKNTDDSFTLVTADASWSGSVTSPSSEPSVGTSYTYLDRYAEFVKIVSYSFVVPEYGSFTITNDGKPVANYATIEAEGVVHVSATPTEGYRFGGWYSTTDGGITRKYFAFTPETDLSFSDDATIGADFRLDNGDALFSVVNGGLYDNLNLAATAANSVSPNIVLVAQDGILRSGNYTIPSGVSLLVPYNKETSIQKKPTIINKDLALSVYRKLVFEEGANITCNGAICVGGQQMCANGGAPSGYTCGACGQIDMSAGGQITLNSGANLYAWGFITGQDLNQGNNTVSAGTITANTGSTVWECFAVGDWRGGTASSNIISTRFFPFQSYFIQNIEVPLAIKNGASEKCYAAVNASSTNYQLPATVIGATDALFKLTDDNSLVRKWFDATTDLICYELSGTANLDAIKIENLPVIGTINSSEFDLPITSNMHLILTNSSVTLSKPMVMQPGAKIEIKEDASVTVATKIYIYDNDNWGAYAGPNYYFHNYGNANGILTRHKNRGNGQSKALLDDAQIILDGMVAFGTSGELYSTAGGADIMGNGDGYIVFPSSIVTSSEKIDAFTSNGDKVSGGVAVNQANLCNEDGSYTKAIASTTFHNVNGRWFAASAKDEKANHTYDFTYISSGAVSGTDGTTSTVDALYAPDKTGLTAGIKWCNVVQDGTCNVEDATHSVIYNATQDLNGKDADSIRYTYQNDAWLQLLKTETEGVYGGSDNSLYAVEDCAVNSLGSVDENCLYTINDVKKALVNGKFVALAKNTNDEAFHNTASTSEYYISFAGCTWHPATKYAGEEKAYIVEGGIYIWYNNDWLLVEHEDPFFFDYNEQNVKRYYEYENGEWVLADPKVRVTDAIETRDFFFLSDAINVASGKKNATITILKDISGIATSLSFTATNTTCTLDLNGHTVQGTANKLLNINGSGSTFTITDSQTGGTLKMTGTPNNACYYNVYVTNGSLVLNKGIISVDNAATYSGDNYALCAVGVASGKSFTMNGGTIYARVNRRAYGIESNGTTKVNGGNITSETTGYGYPYGVFIKAGTTTITSGVTITANAKTTYAHPVYMTGGTLNVTGGTMTATAPTTSDNNFFNSAIRIDGGTANINNATLSVTVTGNSNSKNAYGIYSKGTTTISNCVVSATTKTSGAYAVYTAGGTTTIKSGKFKASAPSAVAGVYKNAGTIIIEDGYFVQNTNLEANLAANRGVYKLTSGTEYSEGYQYDIDKAYTLTWVTDGNDLTGNYTKGKTRVGATITKPSTPTKTGYTFKEWTPTPAATMPSEDKTYTATWTPNTNTAYIVNHYQENLDGTYPSTPTETENLTGTTDVATEAIAKSYIGFTAQSFSQSTIAPDGSTTVSIYYNRDKFTITWKNADGTTLKTDANVKYGTSPAYVGTTPTKTTDSEYAYTFNGWSPALSAVTADVTYTATYTTTPVVASVTINSATTYYTTVDAAFTAANASTTYEPTITLLRDAVTTTSTMISYTGARNCTLNLNGHTLSSTTAQALLYINHAGITFTITDLTESKSGGLHLESATTANRWCVYVSQGNLQMDAGNVFLSSKADTFNEGIRIDPGSGTFTMNGGKVHVETSDGKPACGIDSRGKAVINDGDIQVEASGTGYGIEARVSGTNIGDVTINGGKFLVTGTTAACAYRSNANATLKLQGGYYNSDTDLSTYCATNYHVFPKDDATYLYKVAEAYTVTFKNGDVTLQSGLWEKAATPLYSGETPAKAADAQYTYTFDGWSTTDGGDKLAELPAVSANATYFAHFAQTENKYTVSVAAGANGSVSPASVSEIGCETASADITATPDAGYAFNGWTLPEGVTVTDGYTVASNPIRIHAIAADKTITANFVARNDINYTVKYWQQNIADDDYTEVTADQETKQGTTATETEATAKSYTGFAAQTISQGTIAGDGSTVVSVYYNRIKYAVTWNWNESGTPTTYRDDVKYGAAPVYTYATPTKPSDGTYNYTFTGWSDGTNPYAVGDALPPVTAAITYTAQYAPVKLDLVVAGEYELPGTTAVTNVTVTTDGTLNLTESTTLTTNDLILEATESTAGEIVGADNLTTINAYFDWTINAQRRRWYAVAVPWQVDAEDGISLKGGRKLILGRDFDLIYYNEAVRATNGANKSAWQYVEDDDDKTMQPGRFYMMAFAKAWGNPTTFRFTKKSGASIIYDGTIEVSYTGNDQQHSGWNGIANPALYRAYLNAGIVYGQALIDGDMDNGTRYGVVHLNDAAEGKLPVSRPVFIQRTAGSASTVTINRSQYAAPVPRRAGKEATTTYELRLNATGTTYADRVFFRADDKADDRYTAGSDLMRMGIGKKHAQMWIAAYNQSLCVHTAPWDNEVARMPLTLYAPQVGDYTLNLKQAAADGVKIYLTYEGEAIALLTDEAVTVSLSKGSNAAYGIRIVRTAPGTVTNLDEAAFNGDDTQKVIINGCLYILREGKTYDAQGKLIQ